jgi:phage tail protein X
LFDPRSRYRDTPVATYVDEQGRARPWVTLRVPAPPTATTGYRTRAQDRLDLLAARAYGDPGAWWQMADANPAAAADGPAALLRPPGTQIQLPQPVAAEVLSS